MYRQRTEIEDLRDQLAKAVEREVLQRKIIAKLRARCEENEAVEREVLQSKIIAMLRARCEENDNILGRGWRIFKLSRAGWWYRSQYGYTPHAAESINCSFKEARHLTGDTHTSETTRRFGADNLVVYLPDPPPLVVIPYRIGCEPRRYI